MLFQVTGWILVVSTFLGLAAWLTDSKATAAQRVGAVLGSANALIFAHLAGLF